MTTAEIRIPLPRKRLSDEADGQQAWDAWQVVQRVQAGDVEAFGQIYDRYADSVFRFVHYRVGNRPLAEDLVSECFLRAIKRIHSFTWQGRDFGAWLITIARNLVVDHFKSARTRCEVTTDDVTFSFGDHKWHHDVLDHSIEGSPESTVVDHIRNVTLLEAVKKLNPEQQECIVLRYLQGFSITETARAMGKNDGAIKALAYRATRSLAKHLPDGFQP